MFDDTFVEELVVRRPTVWTVLVRVGLVLVGVLFTMFGFLIIPYVFPLCLAIVCVLIYFLFRAQYVEYEYAFTNGDLDVDRIAGKRFRKRLVSIPESQIRVMAPYQAEYEPEVRGYQVSRKLDVSPSPRAAGRWFLIYEPYENDFGFLVFQPTEKMQSAMKKYLKDRLKGGPQA